MIKRFCMRALMSLFCAVIFAPTASAAIYAYYSFDTGYTDGSGNGRNGTLTDAAPTGNSGITTTSGLYKFGGGALDLAADRDFVNVTGSLGVDAQYTIAFWAKKTPGDTGDALNWDMVLGNNAGTNYFIGLNGTANQLRLRNSSNATNMQSDWTSITGADTDWHHHAVVVDGVANTTTYYLDGVQGSVQTGKASAAFVYNAIGSGYSTNDYDFNGQLDELWIIEELLTSAQVSSLMNVNSIPEPSTFVLGALGLGWLGLQARKRRRFQR